MAIRAGIGLSTAKDHIQAVKEALSEARRNIYKDKFDLAIVFSSIEFAHPGTLKTIGNLLGDIPIIGCSSREYKERNLTDIFRIIILLFILYNKF